jgi:hypothetical protein
MAKGQKRSNREVKKPKQPKLESAKASSLAPATVTAARERMAPGGRDRGARR